jgi:uncharacterized protein (TIGR03437 family)
MKFTKKVSSWITLSSVLLVLLGGCIKSSNTSTSAGTMAVDISGTRPEKLAAGEPELPRVYLNTAYVEPTGRTIAVAAGGNFQTAINQAQPGDVITLQAGATFTGNFTLPNKTWNGQGSPWIIIRSSTPDTNLPAQGTRIAPSYSSVMPKVISPNDSPAIDTARAAHHFRFIGVEFGVAQGKGIYNVIIFDGEPRSLNEMTHDLIIDRCYVHGNTTGMARRGLALNSGAAAVIDSYFSNFHEDGADSQAIAGWNGTGPFKIVNNYLEGAAENFMLGGADPSIQNLVPSDVEFRRNLLSKPLSWKKNDPSYAGQSWTIKNLFELKNAQRVLIDRNIFEYNWSSGQEGLAILFTPRNQEGKSPWSVVQDVTFTNNIIRHVAGGFNISGPDDDEGVSLPSRRILIKNNLLEDVDKRWTDSAETADAEFLQIVAGAENITVDHNTVIQKGNIITADEKSKPNPGFIFRNNIIIHNEYGVFGADEGTGKPALDVYFPGSVFQKNVIVGKEGKENTYPDGNYFPESLDRVGFVNAAGGNYRLSSSSQFRSAGTDGTDIGCNIETLISSSTATSVHAASYREISLAPDTIAAAFGSDLATTTASSTTLPLPTSLSGASIKVIDGNGSESLAPLFFVSPTQINFLIPPGAASGSATILISNGNGESAYSRAEIGRVAPGFFTADATGTGLPTGVALRVRGETTSYESIMSFDSAQNKWISAPIDLGLQTDQVFLILFGTGIRYRSALGAVRVRFSDIDGQVAFAGPQGGFAGLDQVNTRLPRELSGRGNVDLVMTIDGQTANTVQVNFK